MTDLEAFARTIKRLRREPSAKRRRWLLKAAMQSNPGMIRFFRAAFREAPYSINSAQALAVKREVQRDLTRHAVRTPVELFWKFGTFKMNPERDAREWAACVLRHRRELRGVLCCILDRDLKVDGIRELFAQVLEDCGWTESVPEA